jgi:hypothetical protein
MNEIPPWEDLPMKPAIIAHQASALTDFQVFIWGLQGYLLEYYFGGTWINEDRGSGPIQAFVLGCVDHILLRFAQAYHCPDHFNKNNLNFVLVTTRPNGAELVQLPYPLDEDLLGEHSIIRKEFCGRYPATFDRLLFLYGSGASEITYAEITTSAENLINLILSSLFTRMERGESGYTDPSKMPSGSPPTRLCVAKRVQDVPVDSRLVIGSKYVWIPVVPEGKFMRGVLDSVLGYEAPEEEHLEGWKIVYQDLSPMDLSNAQMVATRELDKGGIHSIYRERDQIFVIMEGDLNHPYVWYIDHSGVGKWKRERERSERLKGNTYKQS